MAPILMEIFNADYKTDFCKYESMPSYFTEDNR
jgi:hypothetical protein